MLYIFKIVSVLNFLKIVLLHISMHIIPNYKKHQHSDYNYKTDQTVYTATKLTTSIYYNYNS